MPLLDGSLHCSRHHPTSASQRCGWARPATAPTLPPQLTPTTCLQVRAEAEALRADNLALAERLKFVQASTASKGGAGFWFAGRGQRFGIAVSRLKHFQTPNSNPTHTHLHGCRATRRAAARGAARQPAAAQPWTPQTWRPGPWWASEWSLTSRRGQGGVVVEADEIALAHSS